MRSSSILTLALLTVATATLSAEERREVPQVDIGVEGFQQLLPRGAIAAIVDPVFVPAAEADIPGDAWVLGYARDGEAYAYDLNLLNHHEVVNHHAGGHAIAAVW